MANNQTLSSTTFFTAAQLVEKLWGRNPSPEVKAALVAVADNFKPPTAASLYRSTNEQISKYFDIVPDFLLILYTYQQKVQKGGTHES